MASEIELKLEVPPRMLRTLSRAPWLARMAEAPIKQHQLVSVYFDTGKRELKEEGLSLRVRRNGDHYTQTVKGAAAGSYRRLEWEREIGGALPERKLEIGRASCRERV